MSLFHDYITSAYTIIINSYLFIITSYFCKVALSPHSKKVSGSAQI